MITARRTAPKWHNSISCYRFYFMSAGFTTCVHSDFIIREAAFSYLTISMLSYVTEAHLNSKSKGHSYEVDRTEETLQREQNSTFSNFCNKYFLTRMSGVIRTAASLQTIQLYESGLSVRPFDVKKKTGHCLTLTNQSYWRLRSFK